MNDASVALAARVVLAATLVVSAVAKIRTREAVREQVKALSSGDDRFAAIASVLPAVELLVAVALVAAWSPVPGLVALLLLVVFTGVLIRAQARHVPCACFGAGVTDAPVGPASIVRNGLLAALAVLAIGSPAGADLVPTLVWCAVFGFVTVWSVRAASA